MDKQINAPMLYSWAFHSVILKARKILVSRTSLMRWSPEPPWLKTTPTTILIITIILITKTLTKMIVI